MRLRLAFELHRKQQLTSQLRAALALGPAPPPIKDDLEEFGVAAGEEEEGNTHRDGEKEDDDISDVDDSQGVEV